MVEECGADGPHDDAENEETNGEDGVIGCDLLRSVVSFPRICDHDADRKEERDTSDGEKQYLRPDLGSCCPRGETVPWCEILGSVEDGECGGEHGENDETASKVDTAKENFCYPDSDLDFLLTVSSCTISTVVEATRTTYQVFCLLNLGHFLPLFQFAFLSEGWTQDHGFGSPRWCSG